MAFVSTLNDFRHNLATRFLSIIWLSAIDFSKLVFAGGCVINALCQVPFSDIQEQDINVFYSFDDWIDLEETATSIILRLKIPGALPL